MAILERQQNKSPVRRFSVGFPEETYTTLVEFALSKRITLTKAVADLISKALEAENGEPYKAYTK